jgi:hypothetical protein
MKIIKSFFPQEEPKQETLEEASYRYENSFNESDGTESVDFIEGAKWQAEQLFKDDAIQTLEKALGLLLKKQERMYSEEEVLSIILKLSYDLGEPIESTKEWFSQNKKSL